LENKKFESPTINMPNNVNAMPANCYFLSFFLRNIFDNMAVTMITYELGDKLIYSSSQHLIDGGWDEIKGNMLQ